MAHFPDYQVQSTSVSGNKCTATVTATTKCGPKITAKAAVKASKGDLKQAQTDPVGALKQLERAAVTAAVRLLSDSHDAVVLACYRRKTHNHG